jgi:protein O-mannosyl-transferase
MSDFLLRTSEKSSESHPLKNRAPFLYTFAVNNQTVLICLLLFFLIWKTFLPCLLNDFVNYDDQGYVFQNSHVTSGLTIHNFLWAFSSTTSVNWAPTTMLSHMLDCQLYGLHPWGHHLTSVIVHCFNGILLFLLLRRLTGTVWKSFLVALLFGLHPLRVESVVWISERKDVLSTLFWMLTVLAYSKYAAEAAVKSAKTRLYYDLALLWFLLGLMSKSMLVTLPCILLLLDFWPLGRWNSKTAFSLVKEKTPFFILSGIFSAVTCLSQSPALYRIENLPFLHRFENMLIAYCRYLGKIFYPVDLAVYYPYPVHWSAIRVILSALLLLTISAIVFAAERRRPFMLVGWLWFLGTLFPVIGLIQVGSQSMADRYSYIPSIGIFIILVWGACEFVKRWNVPSAILWVVAVGLVVTCSALTRRQISYWKNGESLWQHAAAVTENNYVAYSLIGFHDLKMTNYDAAITNFQNVIRIMYPVAVKERIGLGAALIKKGRPDEALGPLQEAIWLEPTNAHAYKEIALALLAEGRRGEALTNLVYALKLQPDYLEAKEELHKLTNSSPMRQPELIKTNFSKVTQR